MTTSLPTALIKAIASILAALFLSLFLRGVAAAETTGWVSNEGGRMRLIAMAPDGRGVVRGALQIEPKAGWITYWREPGDAGIPPSITFPSFSGVSLSRMSFPAPKLLTNGTLRDVGYDGAVTLPLELTVAEKGKAAPAKATVFIGLCRNICIPFQAEFTLTLAADTGTSFAEAMLLNKAEARLPEQPSADFAVSEHTVSGDRLHLVLQLPADAPKKAKVIVTGPEGHVLFHDRGGRWAKGRYLVDMPIGKLPKNYRMAGKRWGVLVLAGDRAMETSLPF